MKLEKVSENQIRCTLSKEDLEARGIKISEIAYGNIKAKMLFKDVMQQASYELGFEAENVPLMIEAIPMSTGCIVFIITKVENPEELDTRFSRFAPSIHENENDSEDDEYSDEDEDSEENKDSQVIDSDMFVDLFKKITSKANETRKALEEGTVNSDQNNSSNDTRVFVFDDLENVGKAARILKPIYEGDSSLYKNTEDGSFYLLLDRGYCDKKDFLRICNLLLEYGSHKKASDAAIAFIKEHYKLLIEKDAVQGMAKF